MTLLITMLVLGLLAALSPSTLVVFILLLATTRARVNAAAFLIGWSVSLTAIFVFCYLAGGTHSLRHGGGHTAVAVLEMLLGFGLVLVAARQWGRRDEEKTHAGVSSGLEARLNDLNPVEAAVLGVLEQPWTLTAAAAVVVVRHHTALILAVIAFAAFTVVSTATIGITYLYFARRPGEAEAHLADLRDRVVRAGPAIFSLIALVVGAYLIVDGLVAILRT